MRAAWVIAIIAGLLGIFSVHLALRVAELERQVIALKREPDSAAAEPVAGRAAAPSGAPIEKRLEAIEDDLSQLQEDYAGVDEQLANSASAAAGAPDEARILDVVTRAQNRVRDRQIEFHQQHWRKTRSQLLEKFAADVKLESWQTEELQKLIDDELDAMVELMTRPDMVENPEQAAVEWQRRLDSTDLEAVRVLEPEQVRGWLGARAYERAVLWPWLPSVQEAAKQR